MHEKSFGERGPVDGAYSAPQTPVAGFMVEGGGKERKVRGNSKVRGRRKGEGKERM